MIRLAHKHIHTHTPHFGAGHGRVGQGRAGVWASRQVCVPRVFLPGEEGCRVFLLPNNWTFTLPLQPSYGSWEGRVRRSAMQGWENGSWFLGMKGEKRVKERNGSNAQDKIKKEENKGRKWMNRDGF